MPIDAVSLIRAAFVLATITVLLTYLIPALNSRFLDYGARSSTADIYSAEQEKFASKEKSASTTILDALADVKVPHSWFTYFYLTSVALSVVWIVVLLSTRSSLPLLHPFLDINRPSTPFSHTQLACILMLCQGVRRLAECLVLPSSTSTMWFGHYLVGLFFYIGMSVAIWIEGVPALVQHKFSIHDVEIRAPTWRSAISLLLFLVASGIQHDCHTYLASLKQQSGSNRYQMPTFPAFQLSLTPHYFMECLIYLSLAILTAPEDCWFNGTVVCALAFVVTNLGVTALGTRRWYARKFGEAAVAGRAAMIPFIL